MDHEPKSTSPFLVTGKGPLSSKTLSTLRVMAFLDSRHIHKDLFEHLRQVFLVKNEELLFNFPTTTMAQNEACAELIAASLIQLNEEDKVLSMKAEIQTSVLADMQSAGLIPPLFNAMVQILTGLWPQMICVPNRTVNEGELAVATAQGTDIEAYLKTRYSEGQTSVLQEFEQYARVNLWGRRGELVAHVARLEHIFYHLDDDMVKVCATNTFAMLLAESAWYYLERYRCHDAEAKIQAALGVCQLVPAMSALQLASIRRVHAAIALEGGRADEAAVYVDRQVVGLAIFHTEQGEALRKSGLLDRAPDAVAFTPWGLEVPPGPFIVLPFRSVCSFGWKLYLIADDEKDPLYAQCLYQAKYCFSTALKDLESVTDSTGQLYSRIGEILYALGNVATKQASILGYAHLNESLEFYEKALLHFEGALCVYHDSAAGVAKTRYKLATHNIRSHSYKLASFHVDKAMAIYTSDAAYNPHLARLLFQQSRIQTLTGDPNAKTTLHSAFATRGKVVWNDLRFAEDLSEADFDELIGIWER